ncbi:MAG: S1 RNA-binding domain-containing protein, partial [Anaerolineae bacterium]|nr:S1 RNA-binding domain-containing protein [Anaerolineae bacterium]
MKSEFLMAINQLSAERDLPVQVILEAVEAALVSAYKRDYGAGQNVTAKVDPERGTVRVFVHKQVVEEVDDERTEISLEEARKIDPEAEVGQTITIETTPNNFGRIAAQTAKQVIMQRIREAERERIYAEYAEKEGEIVIGTVRSVGDYGIVLSLGKAEAHLPRSEQIPGERYRPGDRVKAYVTEVEKGTKGVKITVSRTHRNMLKRLLELEVPEIFNGTVEIKAIAR